MKLESGRAGLENTPFFLLLHLILVILSS